MSDPRIIQVDLDEATIIWRNADIEQERRIAIFDLIEENYFKPHCANMTMAMPDPTSCS